MKMMKFDNNECPLDTSSQQPIPGIINLTRKIISALKSNIKDKKLIMAVLTSFGAAGLAYSAYMGGGLKKDL